MDQRIAQIAAQYGKKNISDVATGDVVRVAQRIQEGNKTRTQVFEGVIISREGGNGASASITVRKIASGVGVEKKYPLHSPLIEKITVVKSSKVRRKKIFYLRGLVGKAARLKERQREILEDIGEVVDAHAQTLSGDKQMDSNDTNDEANVTTQVDTNDANAEATEEPKNSEEASNDKDRIPDEAENTSNT